MSPGLSDVFYLVASQPEKRSRAAEIIASDLNLSTNSGDGALILLSAGESALEDITVEVSPANAFHCLFYVCIYDVGYRV